MCSWTQFMSTMSWLWAKSEKRKWPPKAVGINLATLKGLMAGYFGMKHFSIFTWCQTVLVLAKRDLGFSKPWLPNRKTALGFCMDKIHSSIDPLIQSMTPKNPMKPWSACCSHCLAVPVNLRPMLNWIELACTLDTTRGTKHGWICKGDTPVTWHAMVCCCMN